MDGYAISREAWALMGGRFKRRRYGFMVTFSGLVGRASGAHIAGR